jgi:hypothetical protein
MCNTISVMLVGQFAAQWPSGFFFLAIIFAWRKPPTSPPWYYKKGIIIVRMTTVTQIAPPTLQNSIAQFWKKDKKRLDFVMVLIRNALT